MKLLMLNWFSFFVGSIKVIEINEGRWKAIPISGDFRVKKLKEVRIVESSEYSKSKKRHLNM